MKQDVQELITALAHSFCKGLSLEESEVLGMLLLFHWGSHAGSHYAKYVKKLTII